MQIIYCNEPMMCKRFYGREERLITYLQWNIIFLETLKYNGIVFQIFCPVHQAAKTFFDSPKSSVIIQPVFFFHVGKQPAEFLGK